MNNPKSKQIDPDKAREFIKSWWWLIGPALKAGLDWVLPKIKQIFTKKERCKDGTITKKTH